jgi:hypothetical protein
LVNAAAYQEVQMKITFIALSLTVMFATRAPVCGDDDVVHEGAMHDWNLGPTGLRGWMFCDKMVTTGAREILITKVETGAPADGVFLVGDTILGVGGTPFSFDPRTEFGKAVTEAESEVGGGMGQATVDLLKK